MKLVTLDKVGNRLIRYQEEYRRRRIPSPSFYVKMAERKRLADRVRRLRGVSSGPIYPMETKVGHKEIAKKAGVQTARTLQGPVGALSEFDIDALPEKFVIKPTVGSGMNGIFLLEKQNGALIDVVSNEKYPLDLQSLYAAGLSRFEGCPLIAEEFVEFKGVPSLNWKVFSFFGEMGFIREGDYNQADKPYKLWSPEGHDLGPIDRYGFRYDSDLPAPRDFDALIDAARKISLNIITPFVRVDLYESDKGIFLGEITLRTSSLWKKKYLQKFTPEWDRKLGEMWEEAEARIIEKVGENYIP